MPDLSAVHTGALREFARVLRDAAILQEARQAVIAPDPDAYEQVEAELAKRFDNRWVP